MNEGIKQTAEAIVSHPKVSAGMTAMFTSHVWLDYGEPLIKGLTSFLGIAVMVLIVVKGVLDIKRDHFTRAKDDQKRRSSDKVK